jgi:hypothetical protein
MELVQCTTAVLDTYLQLRVLIFLGYAYLMLEMVSGLQTLSIHTQAGSMLVPGIIRQLIPNMAASNLISSWNKDLARQRANAMAGEFRTKGVNVALGPVVGPLGRIAEAGRNWEGNHHSHYYFFKLLIQTGISNDPYLCGVLGAETVQGFQEKGVINSVKVTVHRRDTRVNINTAYSITLATNKKPIGTHLVMSRLSLPTSTTRQFMSCIYGMFNCVTR